MKNPIVAKIVCIALLVILGSPYAIARDRATKKVLKSAVATIPPSGGTLQLDGVVTVKIPNGAFLVPTKVSLYQKPISALGSLKSAYEEGTFMVQGWTSAPKVLFMEIGSVQPKAPIELIITMSKDFISKMPAKAIPFIFARSENESDMEGPYPFFNTISGKYEAAKQVLTISADSTYFQGLKESGGNQAGVFVLGFQKSVAKE